MDNKIGVKETISFRLTDIEKVSLNVFNVWHWTKKSKFKNKLKDLVREQTNNLQLEGGYNLHYKFYFIGRKIDVQNVAILQKTIEDTIFSQDQDNETITSQVAKIPKEWGDQVNFVDMTLVPIFDEEWRDVIDYEGLYQISNKGNIKSFIRSKKGKLLSNVIDKRYYIVTLVKNKIKKNHSVHKMVAVAFLNHTPKGHSIIVDHIDNNPLNNNLYNLQLISNRKNLSKDKIGSSKYTGVSKKNNNYTASIYIDDKLNTIGSFKSEIEASEAYDKVLSAYYNGFDVYEVIDKYKRKETSSTKGVFARKSNNKWYFYKNVNGKQKQSNQFDTEQEAINGLNLYMKKEVIHEDN